MVKLPDGCVLGQTAIVTDPQDRVYLFNRSDHPLVILDRDGNVTSYRLFHRAQEHRGKDVTLLNGVWCSVVDDFPFVQDVDS